MKATLNYMTPEHSSAI